MKTTETAALNISHVYDILSVAKNEKDALQNAAYYLAKLAGKSELLTHI